MSKRAGKITQLSVLVEGETRQGILFADALTDLQESIINAADCSRTISGLAVYHKKSKKKTLQLVSEMVKNGYLRVASVAEIENAAKDVLGQGRLDETLQLYKSILESEPDNERVLRKFAQLLERTAHTRDAAGIYERLVDKFTAESRLGDALVVARKAASLQAGNFRAQDDLAALCVKTGRDDEAARIWRTYAMRLAGIGQYEQGLAIIDSACKNIAGNDTLLYAEAEILAMMAGKKKVSEKTLSSNSELEEQEYETELDSESAVSSRMGSELAGEFTVEEDGVDYTNLRIGSGYAESGYKERGRSLWYVVLMLVVFFIILAAVNYSYRSRMYTAVLESQGLNSLINEVGLQEKIKVGESALVLLDKSKPPFNFMRSSEFENQYARFEILVAEARALAKKENDAYLEFIEEWKQNPTNDLADKLEEFAISENISFDYKMEAETQYEKWQEVDRQRDRDLKDAIGVLADKTLEPRVRFEAYRTLLLDFPEAFRHNYPDGAKDLTVPVVIHAELEKSNKKITVDIAGGARKNEHGELELPVDESIKSYLLHKGYVLSNGEQQVSGRTKIPYPLTYEQLYIFKKVPVIEAVLGLDFVPEKALLLPKSGIAVMAANEKLVLMDLNSLKSVYTEELTASKDPAVALFASESWVGLLRAGEVIVREIVDNALVEGWSSQSIVEPHDILDAGIFDLELNADSGLSVFLSNDFSAATKGEVYPVDVIGVKSGRRVWESEETLRKLADSITSPICKFDRVGWYFAFVSEEGEVVTLMENGDIFKKFSLELAKQERLNRESVDFVQVAGEDYLFAAGRMFRFDFSDSAELLELWHLPVSADRKFAVTSLGVVAYGDSELSVYDVATGEELLKYEYNGKMSVEPVAFGGNLVLATTDRAGSKAIITALAVKSRVKPVLWQYALISPAELLIGADEKLFVYTEKNRALVFAD